MAIRSSGGNYPAITESELRKVLIPTPSLDVQKNIVDTIFEMKTKAMKLQEEGDVLFDKAKLQIEKLILK